MRKGQWVVWQNRGVGIVFELYDHLPDGGRHRHPSGAFVELHLVRDDGTTQLVVPDVRVAELRQACLAEIPAPRRPSLEAGARLGYV